MSISGNTILLSQKDTHYITILLLLRAACNTALSSADIYTYNRSHALHFVFEASFVYATCFKLNFSMSAKR